MLSAELAGVRTVSPAHEEAPAQADETHTRVRPQSAASNTHTHVPTPGRGGADPAEQPEAPELPQPGRHASRHADPGVARLLAERMPDTMRGRVRLTPAQLTMVALVVAVGLALAAWWAIRSGSTGEPVPAATPGSPTVAGLETPPPTAGTSSAPSGDAAIGAPATTVVVDVVGAVRTPGIVVLATGSRVVDAIEAAGGAKKGVDLGTLNQARLLVDGEQIVVGVPMAPGVAAPAAPSATTSTLVNINTATQEQLEELPGVGPVTALAVIDWRTANGGFTNVDELLAVDGIGDATLAELAPYVTI